MKAIITLLIASASYCLSQSTFTFPFHSGDTWQYWESGGIKGPDTRTILIKSGVDTTMPNKKTYRPFYNYAFGTAYFRKDGETIYQYSQDDSTEYLKYDFSKTVGDTVSYINPFGLGYAPFFITEDEHMLVFDTQRRVVEFYYYYTESNLVFNEAISDSIGIIYFRYNHEWDYNLRGAIIAGKIYGSITSENEVKNRIPIKPNLYQNYPNPFNPSTIINYDLPNTMNVEITIYNVVGQKLQTLVNSTQQKGSHTVTWNASRCSSGTYFCRMRCGDFLTTSKLILIK